ncbi:hypothetical protein CFK39_10660 [Brachybacterium avium]|uniref:DUF4190 domain-containing protein n=1 Tax=Brachybacterium avium TaxID=2017485 RepID=A0A220UDJ8_9MICO|nr:hypothetical protein [Brachybacterium avium]ASK66199.1 hypothetical protein CFK39_10660 [Brachybacterium avium]
MTMPPYRYDGGTPSDSAPAGPGTSSGPPAATATSAPLATAALIVCIAAFVLGLVPLLGAALGLVGIVLVIVAARRGLATKRTYAGALAAAVGALASIAASIALVGLVLTPNDPGTSGPTVAAEGIEEADQDVDTETETETEPSDPAEEDSAPEADPVTENEPLAEEEPVATQEAPREPTEGPSPAPTEAPDLSIYEELDERTLAQIVKAPDDHLGRQVIVYGAITQLDAATGKCFVRISIAEAPQDAWYDYEHNSVGFAGDGESDCPVLDPFVADDEVKLWITIGGSISYDTQIGGSTTVPAYLIDEAELL